MGEVPLSRQGIPVHRGDAEEVVGPAAPRRLPNRSRRTTTSSRRGSHFTRGTSRRRRTSAGKAGDDGITVANKAQAIYANYLEENEKRKLKLFEEVAQRAEDSFRRRQPKNANAYYWQAYALGRYAQGISVVKALAQGHRRQGEECAGNGHQARAEARRRAHRPGRVSRGNDRQGRRHDRRTHVRREEGHRDEACSRPR